MSDVTFVLRDEAGREQCVKAHRVILACVSVRFRALFTSGFRESTYGADDLECEEEEEEATDRNGAGEKQRAGLRIDVPDVPHAVFIAMIEYLYTGSAAALEFAYRETPPPLRSSFGVLEGDDLVQIELQRERISFVVALMQVRCAHSTVTTQGGLHVVDACVGRASPHLVLTTPADSLAPARTHARTRRTTSHDVAILRVSIPRTVYLFPSRHHPSLRSRSRRRRTSS